MRQKMFSCKNSMTYTQVSFNKTAREVDCRRMTSSFSPWNSFLNLSSTFKLSINQEDRSRWEGKNGGSDLIFKNAFCGRKTNYHYQPMSVFHFKPNSTSTDAKYIRRKKTEKILEILPWIYFQGLKSTYETSRICFSNI